MNQFEKLQNFISQLRPLSETYGQKTELDDIASALNKVEENTNILLCGEFKRGKSSLINAIINEGICPTDEGIATATITKIKYGAKKKAVRYYGKSLGTDGKLSSEEIEWDDISKYTMGNLEDLDNTVYIEIYYPSDWLKRERLTIIDTPGIGGLDPRHASLTSMAIPEADIVCFVTDAGEPLTESETKFYKSQILSTGKPALVLINKSDYLTQPELESHIQTTRKSLALEDSSNLVPVSALNWILHNQTGDEDLLIGSNKKEVLDAISALKLKRIQSALIDLRNLLKSAADKIKEAIALEIAQLKEDADKQQKSLNDIIKSLNELSNYKRELENPTSALQLRITSIFENARNDVSNFISHEGTYLSSTLFNQYLNDERSLSNDGKWLIAQINDKLVDLRNEIEKMTNDAFKSITKQIKKTVIDDVSTNLEKINDNVQFSNAISSQLVFSAASKLTVGGLVGTLTYGVVAAITTAGVGIVAGLAAAGMLIWKRLYAENAERKKAELRQQIPPKINLAITDLRNQAMTRFTKFHQKFLFALRDLISETEAKLKSMQNSLMQAKNNSNERNKLIDDLDKKEQKVATLVSQISLLYSQPFNGPQQQPRRG